MDGSASSAEDSIPVRELLFNSHLTWEDGTPEIIPGKKTRVLFCREADAGSQKHHTSSTGMTHLPGGLDGTHAPQSGVWWSIIFLLELPHFFFFFLVILEAFTWIFPCSGFLYVSIIFQLLGGLVSDRQQRQLVLTESMCSWRKCGLSRCHPTHGKEVTATQDEEMYRLYLYR